MCWTQKFSFSADPVILDLKLQLARFAGKDSALISESAYKCIPPPALIVILRFCWKSMVLSAALIRTFRYKCCIYIQAFTVINLLINYNSMGKIVYHNRLVLHRS